MPKATPVEPFAEVLTAAARGDREALGSLWRAWNPRLVRYLSARGAASPEDLAADVWIDVARGLSRFDGDERSWPRWLFTIARNRLIDDGRARSRRLETPGEIVAGVADPGWEPEAVVVSRTALAEAVRTVRRLPDDQADAILLRVLAGLDVPTVAVMLGKQPGAVRVLTHRGLRRLAELTGTRPEVRASRDGGRIL